MDPKAVHLYNLAHFKCLSAVSKCHAVASDNHIYNTGITPPRADAHCDACGIMHVPGLTLSTRISYLKSKKARSRTLHITCLVCRHIRVEKCLLDAKPVQEIKVKVSKGKKKRSDLSALLEAKKQQKLKTTLSLMEFMQ